MLYVEVLKNHCNAVGRTFCDAIITCMKFVFYSPGCAVDNADPVPQFKSRNTCFGLGQEE